MSPNGSPHPSPPSKSKSPADRRRSGPGWLVGLLLVLAGAFAVSFVPGIRGQLNSLIAQPVGPRMNTVVTVWANKQTGNYYCAGSAEYGKGLGSYMKQGQALTAGYQPELSQYCDHAKSEGITGHSR